MELVLHSSAGWVQLVCTILWLPLWFLSLLFCFLFAFLFFSSRHFAFYGQAFAISFPCLTQSMIRCVHSSNSSSRATIRSRNRSRSKQPEHFRWLAATASAVALPFPPSVCLSVSVCVVLCCHQHTKPQPRPLRPFADGVVCFLFCTRFMSCGNWIVSGIEQWLLSVRPPSPTSSENVVTQLMLFDVQRGRCSSRAAPSAFLCLWFAYAVAKLVSRLSLVSLSSLSLALVINLQKFFFMPKPVQGLVSSCICCC